MRIECDTYIEAVIPIYILGYFEYKFFFFFGIHHHLCKNMRKCEHPRNQTQDLTVTEPGQSISC